MAHVSPQKFLDILKDPEGTYLREGVQKFKTIMIEQLFDYTAEFVGRNKDVYRITTETDDQDAIDDLDKYFTLCFANVLHLVSITPKQFVDTYERQYFIYKMKRRG